MPRALKDRWFWLACCLFAVCTFVFLYPYSFDPGHTVSDPGDPLLNISTLWRVQQHLGKGEFLNLYEANYFYPRKHVLAYSEIMLPTAVIAWPVAAISGNPVLGYNFSFLLAYFLTGLFMFLLVRHLTGSPAAGIVSGLLFSFCQWRFNRPAHMQLLTNQWTPLMMLFLHKFWQGRRLRHIILAAVFFAIQTMSCIYLGLIFSIAAGISLVMIWLSHYNDKSANIGPNDGKTGQRRKLSLLVKPALPILVFGGAAFAALIGPIYPYLRLSSTLEKARWRNVGADLLGYLTATKYDWLWGSTKLFVGRGEQVLFPGAVAIVLVCIGWLLRRRNSASVHSGTLSTQPTNERILKILIGINRACVAIIGGVMVFRILAVNVRGINLGFIPLAWPVNMALLTWVVILVLRKLQTGRFMVHIADQESLYVVVAIAGLVLSLGAKMRVGYYSYGMGPFQLLAWVFPPFGGMRAIGRFGILGLFAFFVLVGFATMRIETFALKRWGDQMRQRVIWLIIIASVASCFPLLPFPGYHVPDASELPACYKWLREQPGKKVVIEIPMHPWIDPQYMYYALFHKKSLINGYSGWFPPEYDLTREVMAKCLPSRWSAVLLDEIGVDYIFFHPDRLSKDPYGQFPSSQPVEMNLRQNGLDNFRIIRRFSKCIVLQTKRAAEGLPRGPFLASRKLLFEASFGHVADGDQAFDLRGQIEVPQKHSLRGNEITFSFDEPVSFSGLFADFHQRLKNPYYCPFGVLVETEPGAFRALPLTLELSLFEYRKKLYGHRFSQVTEFTFPQVVTGKIRLILRLDDSNERPLRLDLWGYSYADKDGNQ